MARVIVLGELEAKARLETVLRLQGMPLSAIHRRDMREEQAKLERVLKIFIERKAQG